VVALLPALDANASAVAIEHIKVESEGWQRDEDGVEASESRDGKPPD